MFLCCKKWQSIEHAVAPCSAVTVILITLSPVGENSILWQSRWQRNFSTTIPNLQGILRSPQYTQDASFTKHTRQKMKITHRWSPFIHDSWEVQILSIWNVLFQNTLSYKLWGGLNQHLHGKHADYIHPVPKERHPELTTIDSPCKGT